MEHRAPKNDADMRTDIRGPFRSRWQAAQLFLQFFGTDFPLISAPRQVTVGDPQLSNLLLFLGRALLPPITTGSEFPCFSGHIPFVAHHCIPTWNTLLDGTDSGMNSNTEKQHRLDSLRRFTLALCTDPRA
jgi:hypothetical protein